MKNYFKRVLTQLKKHKKVALGTAIFITLGIVGLIIGFEIEQKGHAFRNWVQTEYFTTTIIIISLSVLILIFVLIMWLGWKENNKNGK